jgi:uncharacterized protein YbaR (Trm112 family)
MPKSDGGIYIVGSKVLCCPKCGEKNVILNLVAGQMHVREGDVQAQVKANSMFSVIICTRCSKVSSINEAMAALDKEWPDGHEELIAEPKQEEENLES